jgi:Zn-dependent peptidase ImmA (M78 family)
MARQTAIDKILTSFHGRIVGSKQNKKAIASVILLLPKDTIKTLIDTTWFVSGYDETFGFVLSKNDIKNRNIIFLSDNLFKESELQITYTILHEIGHVILKHRNSFDDIQSKREIEKQEKEADEFALEYLQNISIH